MFKSNSSRFACLISTIALAVGLATPAGAQPNTQEGLVNVNVSGVTIQAPISVAANICDVNVNVLSAPQIDLPADCDASAESDAVSVGAEGPPPEQDGLVNVNISDVVVQLPITVAANVCDVNVNVLSAQLDAPADCDAVADSDANEH